jgi:hypothetical protein
MTTENIKERAWVDSLVPDLRDALRACNPAFEVSAGQRIRYSNEIRRYTGDDATVVNGVSYETDLSIIERLADGGWIPRVIVEMKLKSVTTHDAITYSQKAAAHKTVHPYLRYGIMIGNRGTKALPGRLFRHGAEFDFMMIFRAHTPTPDEASTFTELLLKEVEASRALEQIVFDTRSRTRTMFTVMRKPLELR